MPYRGYGDFEVTVKCLTCNQATSWNTKDGNPYTKQYVSWYTSGGCESCESADILFVCDDCKRSTRGG